MQHKELLDEALDAIAWLRRDGGHLHSITNTVAQNFTANVLLACGASVSMTVNADEMDAFAAAASALHVNLGTLDAAREKAIHRAVACVRDTAKPIVLDPVKVDLSPLRLKLATALLPDMSIVRGNRAEMTALAGASASDLVWLETGKIDTLRAGRQTIHVHNGAALMDRLIATGCAQGALVAILATRSASPLAASLAGSLWFSVAGEIAAHEAHGPGTFQPRFLDTLATVSLQTLREKADLS